MSSQEKQITVTQKRAPVQIFIDGGSVGIKDNVWLEGLDDPMASRDTVRISPGDLTDEEINARYGEGLGAAIIAGLACCHLLIPEQDRVPPQAHEAEKDPAVKVEAGR